MLNLSSPRSEKSGQHNKRHHHPNEKKTKNNVIGNLKKSSEPISRPPLRDNKKSTDKHRNKKIVSNDNSNQNGRDTDYHELKEDLKRTRRNGSIVIEQFEKHFEDLQNEIDGLKEKNQQSHSLEKEIEVLKKENGQLKNWQEKYHEMASKCLLLEKERVDFHKLVQKKNRNHPQSLNSNEENEKSVIHSKNDNMQSVLTTMKNNGSPIFNNRQTEQENQNKLDSDNSNSVWPMSACGIL